MPDLTFSKLMTILIPETSSGEPVKANTRKVSLLNSYSPYGFTHTDMNVPVETTESQQPTALLTTHQAPTELERVINDWTDNEKSIAESAQSIHISPQALYKRMYKHTFKQIDDGPYKEKKRQAVVSRVAEADYKLSIASTSVDVARAREECKFARMDLERLCPDLYAPKQQITMDKEVHVHVHRLPQHIDGPQALKAADPQVIDIVKGEANGSG